MSDHKYDAGDLSEELAERIEQVVDELKIDVKRRTGRKLYCFAPWDGHHNPKLEIQLYPIRGKWNEWITGKRGDAFDLVACVLGGGDRDRKEAYRWTLEFLGLSQQRSPADWERRRQETRAKVAKRQAEAAAELAKNRTRAKAMWLGAKRLAPGDDGWAYLLARGIDLADLPAGPNGQHLVNSVRFSEREGWWDDQLRETTHYGPCLMAAMTLSDGAFGSLHRTWLDPFRPGEKADLSPPRKMWPASEGAAIRLWRGGSGLSEADAFKRGIKEACAVGEGVEDGLSVALMDPTLRVSAAGSLGGLLSFVPPVTADRLIICADNDWGKPQSQALLDKGCARLSGEFGLAVSLARSPGGKDFNDLLRGRA